MEELVFTSASKELDLPHNTPNGLLTDSMESVTMNSHNMDTDCA